MNLDVIVKNIKFETLSYRLQFQNPATSCALKAKFFLKGFRKFSDKNSILESPCHKM